MSGPSDSNRNCTSALRRPFVASEKRYSIEHVNLAKLAKSPDDNEERFLVRLFGVVERPSWYVVG
jgi:hypothetical protein